MVRFLRTKRMYHETRHSPTAFCSLNRPPGEEDVLSLVSALTESRGRPGPCAQRVVALQTARLRFHACRVSLAASWAAPPFTHSFLPETLTDSSLCAYARYLIQSRQRHGAHAVVVATPRVVDEETRQGSLRASSCGPDPECKLGVCPIPSHFAVLPP